MFSGFWWKVFTEFANSFGRPKTQIFFSEEVINPKNLPCPVSPCRKHRLVLSMGQTQPRCVCPPPLPVQAQSYPRKAAEMLVLIIHLGHI